MQSLHHMFFSERTVGVLAQMDSFLEILNSFLGAEYSHRPLIGRCPIPYILLLSQAKRETTVVLSLTQGFPNSWSGHKEWNRLLPAL